MHTSEYIFWKPFQKTGKRITQILPCRASSIAINCLNTREATVSYIQIYNRHLKDQKPVVEAFLLWTNKQDALNGSHLSRALTYAKNQQNYMMTYLEDGHCSISNNLSENPIAP